MAAAPPPRAGCRTFHAAGRRSLVAIATRQPPQLRRSTVGICGAAIPAVGQKATRWHGAVKQRSRARGLTEPAASAALEALPFPDGPVGVVVVDHGSRREESNHLLYAFVELYKEQSGRHLVEPAHMELAEPSIAQAFDRCVEQGARCVVVSPYFLSPGRHWSQDIPALTAEAASKHPGIGFLVTAPIGVHRLVAQVLEERIEHCMSQVRGTTGKCDICRGTDKCAYHTVGL
eukprot:SM000162S02374  [mRNA]  locus=s162:176625:177973:- [translate_table: standard]